MDGFNCEPFFLYIGMFSCLRPGDDASGSHACSMFLSLLHTCISIIFIYQVLWHSSVKNVLSLGSLWHFSVCEFCFNAIDNCRLLEV